MKNYLILFTAIVVLVSCKREGCADPKAINFDFGSKVIDVPELCIYDNEDSQNDLTKVIICSDLTQNVTWPKVPGASVDYYVNCRIKIYQQLVISPGVVIEFGPEGELYTQGNGSIFANGTASERITLRGVNQENWKGITFTNSAYYSNTLNYTDIEDAYNTQSNSSINFSMNGEIKCNNVTIRNSPGYGISASYYKTTSQFQNTTIENCAKSVILPNSTISLLNNLASLNFSNTENFIEMPDSYIVNFSLSSSLSNPIYFSGTSFSDNIYFDNITVTAANTFVFHEKYMNIGYTANCSIPNGGKLTLTSKDPAGFWLGISANMNYSHVFNNIKINNVALSQGSIRLTNFNASNIITVTNSIIECGVSTSCGIHFSNTSSVPSSNYNITGTTFTCSNQVCP